MAAPKNNQFWKLRSKHGRDKIFDSPELLWNAACEYKNNKSEFHPYLITEFCKYIKVNTTYFNQIKDLTILESINKIKNSFNEHNIDLYKKGLISVCLVARFLKDKSKMNVEINEKSCSIKNRRTNCNLNLLLKECGYIYFLKSKCSKYYKIGYSSNPKRRLRDICQVLPFNVEILIVKKNDFALTIENKLHEKYKEYSIKNEWFSFNKKQEIEIYKYLTNLI